MKIEYETHSDVTTYIESLALAIQERTSVVPQKTVPVQDPKKMRLVLDSEPTEEDIDEISDILASTNRHVYNCSGRELTVELIEREQVTFDERIGMMFSAENGRGRKSGVLTEEDVDVTCRAGEVTVVFNKEPTEEDVARLDNVMLSYGKVRKQ